MVAITPELVAILAYTAFALFLSLYFVPFKVVPKAWAKAVRTDGHPAKLALDAVLEGAAPKVAKAVVLPDTKAVEATVKSTAEAFNSLIPVIQDIAKRTEDAKLKALVGEVIRNHEMAARARSGAGNTDITPADMEVITAAGAVAENPESTQLAAGLINLIEIGMNAGTIQEKAGEKTIRKIQGALAAGQDLMALRDQLAKSFPKAFARQQQQGGGQGGGGRSGGPEKLGL